MVFSYLTAASIVEPMAFLVACHLTNKYACLLACFSWTSFAFHYLLWTPAQRSLSEVHYNYFANDLKKNLWPPYSPALVNGDSRNFYTWWTLSVIREVTTCIFSWLFLNYKVGQKVTKFGIFSHRTRKLSALTPERGRML